MKTRKMFKKRRSIKRTKRGGTTSSASTQTHQTASTQTGPTLKKDLYDTGLYATGAVTSSVKNVTKGAYDGINYGIMGFKTLMPLVNV